MDQRFTRSLQAYIWEVPSWILGLGGIHAWFPLGLKALPHRQHIQGNDGNGHCMGRFTNCRVLWQGYKRQNPHLQTCKCLHPCEGRGDDRGTRRGKGCGGRRSDLSWKYWSCFVSHWMPLLGFQIWFHIQDVSVGILIANVSLKRQCFLSQISLRFFDCFKVMFLHFKIEQMINEDMLTCCLECGGSLLHFTVLSATAPCCSVWEVPSVSSRSRRHECQPKWFVWRVRLVRVEDIWC